MIPTSELETLDVLVHIIRFVHRRHQSQLTPADKQYTSMSKSTNSMPSQRKKHVRRQVQMFKTWESVLQHMGLLLTRH
jgi:hypothetical protein